MSTHSFDRFATTDGTEKNGPDYPLKGIQESTMLTVQAVSLFILCFIATTIED